MNIGRYFVEVFCNILFVVLKDVISVYDFKLNLILGMFVYKELSKMIVKKVIGLDKISVWFLCDVVRVIVFLLIYIINYFLKIGKFFFYWKCVKVIVFF